MTAALPTSPPRGLRRRSWTEAPFASLDFETTGLDYASDDVVSFGVVPVDRARIAVGAAIHQLVRPSAPPSPTSVKIHGMRAQDLAGAPRGPEAREVLRTALDERFILSWYAPVEIAFLARMFEGGARRFRRRTIDVRELAIQIDRRRGHLSGSPEYSLSACAARYVVPVANPHDALDDALVTAQLFLVLAERLRGEGLGTVARLLRAGRS